MINQFFHILSMRSKFTLVREERSTHSYINYYNGNGSLRVVCGDNECPMGITMWPSTIMPNHPMGWQALDQPEPKRMGEGSCSVSLRARVLPLPLSTSLAKNWQELIGKIPNRSLVPKALLIVFILVLSGCHLIYAQNEKDVKMAYFQVDVTPALGSPLAFGTAQVIRDSLSARGIVLIFDERPVVIVAVDWIGIANEGMDVFRQQLAQAVNTTEDRVSVHALHLHDAVRCDFLTPRIMNQYGDSEIYYDTSFLHNAITRVANGAQEAMKHLQTVTDIGFGQAKVRKVASNRRILDHHGNVQMMRWSHTTDFLLRHESEGKIDPWLKMVTLYNDEEPLVSLSYYAVHPVTEFGDGVVSTEFVGIARKFQEKKRGYPHIYFTGAAGNIGVGKYNDGSEGIRYLFATRISMAMDDALKASKRKPIQRSDVKWRTTGVYLPLADYMNRDSLERILSGERHDPELPYLRAVGSLAWWIRVHKEPYVRISALELGDIQLLSLPGEPFVEYQLAAQQLFPDYNICTAAYEEYGMGYIGTKEAYSQGGYETSKMASTLAPESADELLKAIKEVLKGKQ